MKRLRRLTNRVRRWATKRSWQLLLCFIAVPLIAAIYSGLSAEPAASSSSTLSQGIPVTTGNQITINGQRFNAPWQIQAERIGVADFAAENSLGLSLLSNSEARLQPVQWFSDPNQTPLNLAAWLEGGYRFLDLSEIAQLEGWQTSFIGSELQIIAPISQVQNIRLGKQAWGDRIVIDLTDKALWNLRETPGEFTVVVNGASSENLATVLEEYQAEGSGSSQLPGNLIRSLQITTGTRQTIISGSIPENAGPSISMLTGPNRLVIDIRQDYLRPLSILWAPGVRWRQQYLSVGGRAFPVHWLEVNPLSPELIFRPIWSDPTTATGLTPLITMAQRWQAAAAINSGFFNRNNQYPLGAIRRDDTWISGPILGRGAIAWDDSGNFLVGRLALDLSLTTDQNQQFPIQTINSGYVQAGIGLYTPAWGRTYTPITDNETVVTIVGDQVVNQQATKNAGTQSLPIPADGYLLVVRSLSAAVNALTPSTQIQITERSLPSSFDNFPQIMAAGPLLLNQRQVVLNAQAEGFSQAFATQAAPRSAIGLAAAGQVLLATAHFSPTGRGPTLNEMAEIMKQLGSVDALNLDGGSSSSLYLGGRLLNRNARTAGRVNNGIGIFLQP